MAIRTYTRREIAYIRRHYGRRTVRQIAAALGRSPAGVMNKIVKLGLQVGGQESTPCSWERLQRLREL